MEFPYSLARVGAFTFCLLLFGGFWVSSVGFWAWPWGNIYIWCRCGCCLACPRPAHDLPTVLCSCRLGLGSLDFLLPMLSTATRTQRSTLVHARHASAWAGVGLDLDYQKDYPAARPGLNLQACSARCLASHQETWDRRRTTMLRCSFIWKYRMAERLL